VRYDRESVWAGESVAIARREKGDKKACRRSGYESFDRWEEGSVRNGLDPDDSRRMRKRRGWRRGGGKSKFLDRYLARLL